MTKKETVGHYGRNEALIDARHSMGVTRADVAYNSGLTKAGLTRIETGQRFGDWATMYKLSRYYHKSVDELFFKDLKRRAKDHNFDYKLDTIAERRYRLVEESKKRKARERAFDRKYHITAEDMKEAQRLADEHHKEVASK